MGSIFEIFTQVSRSLDRPKGGLGIGLSLVRHLVSLHGGEVAAESAGPGQGSSFTVGLPLAREQVVGDPGPLEGGHRRDKLGYDPEVSFCHHIESVSARR